MAAKTDVLIVGGGAAGITVVIIQPRAFRDLREPRRCDAKDAAERHEGKHNWD
jgi:hypothetical protein